MISDDDVTLVILAPSQAMGQLLRELENAFERLSALPGAARREVRPVPWESIDLAAFVHEAARLPLLAEGWPEGEIPEGDLAAGEVLHELATDSDMMSGEDLESALRSAVEGRGAASEWRRISEVESIGQLLKNDTAIGWSGFEVMNRDETLRQRLERRRMMTDHFRDRFDWRNLRVHDLLGAARLLEKALAAEVVAPDVARRWQARIGAELLLRADGWRDIARDALLGALWSGLEKNEKTAGEALALARRSLEALLSAQGAWSRRDWPEQAPDEEPPAVYGF